jgi:4-methyl-5(b-hydroxyethyl)-thiazole monophosphate biosynthesis
VRDISTYILYFDGFCEFEIVLCALQFREHYSAIALENRVYVSEGKQKLLPDQVIDEVDPKEVDLLIIPGGNLSHLYDNEKLKRFMHQIDENDGVIAGICAGSFLMAQYGLLESKRCTGSSSGLAVGEADMTLYDNSIIVHEDVVIDGNMITSTGQAYVSFAYELCKLMKIYRSEREAEEAYEWLKNWKG